MSLARLMRDMERDGGFHDDDDGEGAGEPHIVLEVRDGALDISAPSDVTDVGSSAYGKRLDMRILCRAPRGELSAYWVESYAFIPYTGAGA